jgi:hypothetical protein
MPVMRGWAAAVVLAVCAVALAPRTAGAQVQFGAEVLRDRSTWRFEHPSSYNTAELVPHVMEQQYTLDNVWLTASVGYRAGADWRTTGGATPVHRALATDYDTFFNPGGVVWVSGTTGDAEMHGFRLAQEVGLGRAHGVRLAAGYRVRVDLADFLEGYRTDTRNGVIVSQAIVTTREYTNAQTHEAFVSGWHQRDFAQRWRLRLSGDVSPVTLNRLAIQLPDKYPGLTLVYRATTLMAGGRADLIHTGTNWPMNVSVRADRSWNYQDTQEVHRSSLAVGLSIGRTW